MTVGTAFCGGLTSSVVYGKGKAIADTAAAGTFSGRSRADFASSVDYLQVEVRFGFPSCFSFRRVGRVPDVSTQLNNVSSIHPIPYLHFVGI